ncbi:MAG: GTPase HflX [Planctomycetes bacterium]|nr:GTPase HflX [Planctomycetota bacterium]MBM4083332.1 GTPase HflX [Planctomycetota bacterium]
MELKRTDLTVRQERAVLVRAVLPDERTEETDPLEELRQLAETAGARVVEGVVQRRPAVDATFYIGKGKVQEISGLCAALDADVIICDDDLTPAQIRNLERATNRKVIDRSELILDIFATHARTRQAKLQVELAQLEYTSPRLTRMWSHLERIEGGIGTIGGLGTRGPGERQLESDRRLVRNRITDLRHELRRIEKRKEREVESRREHATVSLVGYTNSGKSTLMNALTGAGVLVEDKLFSTLDTKTRSCSLGNGHHILLSDTVGFIKKLPHHLVASFHATLEEARQADLLLHVADASSAMLASQVKAVDEALLALGCHQKPTLMVLNKADKVSSDFESPLLSHRYPRHVLISALRKQGLDELKQRVIEFIDAMRVEAEVLSPVRNGKLLAFLADKGQVLSRQYEEEWARVRVLMSEKHLGKLAEMEAEVKITRLTKHDPALQPSGAKGD